jgi:hypothetical protein
MNEQLIGLLGLDPEKIRQQQQMQGLLSAGLNILSAAGPSRTPTSLGQIVGQAGMAGLQGYQQAGESAIDRAIKGLQVSDVIRRQQEAQNVRNLAGQLYRTEQTPLTSTDVEAQAGGFYGQPGVNAPQTRQVLNQSIVNQLMSTPAGMEYLTSRVKAQRELAGKTEVVEIFSPTGQPMKVRYNVDTGDFTPLGGEKAEPFVQIDRGNAIELRRTSGQLIGTLSKGVAPVAPSFTMTDFGVLNTKTGQVVPPTDAQGRPIAIDPTIKASEDERKSAGFYLRMRDATNTLNSPITDAKGDPVLKDSKPVLLKDAAEKPELFAEIVGGIIPNWMGGQAAQNFATSSLRQRYQQAQENWVTANLRPESGAVIGAEEMAKEIRKYFPQIGDSPDAIRQKEESRKVTEEAIRRRAGRALGSTTQEQRNITVNY